MSLNGCSAFGEQVTWSASEVAVVEETVVDEAAAACGDDTLVEICPNVDPLASSWVVLDFDEALACGVWVKGRGQLLFPAHQFGLHPYVS